MITLVSFTRHLSRARRNLLSTVFALSLTAGSGILLAHDYRAGDLRIDHPWTRATPGGAKVGGGFMRITNTGKTADRLLGGTLVGAGSVEIHETRREGEVMRMRRLEQGLTIAPGQTLELKPGSYHVMFMQLGRGFTEGERMKGTLVFEKAGTIEVEFTVEAMGARAGAGEHKH
jgi:copper(I)-binding protein